MKSFEKVHIKYFLIRLYAWGPLRGDKRIKFIWLVTSAEQMIYQFTNTMQLYKLKYHIFHINEIETNQQQQIKCQI